MPRPYWRGHNSFMRRRYRLTSYLLSLLLLIVLWQLASGVVGSLRFGGSASAFGSPLPGPLATAEAIAANHAELVGHLLYSAGRVVAALVVSTLAGILVGVPSRERWYDAVCSPLVFLTYPFPKVLLLPVIFLLFGIGEFPKIVLVSLIVFYQVVVATRDAALQVSPAWIDVMRSLGYRRLSIYWRVILPAVFPSVLTSLKIGVGTAVSVLFIAESAATRSRLGLGLFISNSRNSFDYPAMYAGIVVMALLGAILYGLIALLESRFAAWARR